MGYKQSVKSSNSDSLNIATLKIAALLQKNPLTRRVEHSLRSWTYIACLDVRSFEGGAFCHTIEGYLARTTIDKIAASYKTVY